ncbi:hypothetical protein [Shouchella clausii]|uniref:Uncharacterized protein n=1 Tax=Shouchella clausii TaxID=79880 RepID=A0A268NW47_SHOCL|nr:hypothetical protein [Shouchella clausii]PAE87638.1 hypothetical protein CHH72_17280 [Shouchella clausii]
MQLEIKKIDGLKWKTEHPDYDYLVCKGYALYSKEKGYLGFNSETPYTPNGGKATLQSIIDAGGLIHYDDVYWIKPIRSS